MFALIHSFICSVLVMSVLQGEIDYTYHRFID